MPTKAEQVFEAVRLEESDAPGISRVDAFERVALKLGTSPAAVRANYYRQANAVGLALAHRRRKNVETVGTDLPVGDVEDGEAVETPESGENGGSTTTTPRKRRKRATTPPANGRRRRRSNDMEAALANLDAAVARVKEIALANDARVKAAAEAFGTPLK